MRVQLEKAPEEILRRAVYGMLPKNNLRKVCLYKRHMFGCEVSRLLSGACCMMHANQSPGGECSSHSAEHSLQGSLEQSHRWWSFCFGLALLWEHS